MMKIKKLLKKAVGVVAAAFGLFFAGFFFKKKSEKKIEEKKTDEIKKTPASDIVHNADNAAELNRAKQELKAEFRESAERIKQEFYNRRS